MQPIAKHLPHTADTMSWSEVASTHHSDDGVDSSFDVVSNPHTPAATKSEFTEVPDSGARTPASTWDTVSTHSVLTNPHTSTASQRRFPRRPVAGVVGLTPVRAELLTRLHMRRLQITAGIEFAATTGPFLPPQTHSSWAARHLIPAGRNGILLPARIAGAEARADALRHPFSRGAPLLRASAAAAPRHHRMERAPQPRGVLPLTAVRRAAVQRKQHHQSQALTRKQQARVVQNQRKHEQHRQQKDMRKARASAAGGPSASSADAYLANMQRKQHVRKTREKKRMQKRSTPTSTA